MQIMKRVFIVNRQRCKQKHLQIPCERKVSYRLSVYKAYHSPSIMSFIISFILSYFDKACMRSSNEVWTQATNSSSLTNQRFSERKSFNSKHSLYTSLYECFFFLKKKKSQTGKAYLDCFVCIDLLRFHHSEHMNK